MARPSSTGRKRNAARTGARPKPSVRSLKAKLTHVRANLGAARHELETLYAALDNVQCGLLILDANMQARYSNPALHTMFNTFTPGYIRKEKPFYKELLQAAAAAAVVDIEDYVAKRLAWIASGDPVPMDLNMANETVLRCQLAILPDGGRMLIYSNVTDIVRTAREMERLASVDGMTGIYNRRHFLALADREWDRARRYQRPLSLLMIDIDYFKAINDRFGHQIGDQTIVHVAKIAASSKRTCDLLARIGGEEFAILLPETDAGPAQLVAERLRCQIAGCPPPRPAHPITVSIGIATADAHMSSISDLMKVADHALYAAKHAGRNKVMCNVAARAAPALECAGE